MRAPFFWRWPEWYQPCIAEGIKPCLKPDFTCYTEKQSPERDLKVTKQVLEKLALVVMKGYVVWNPKITSYTHYFSVRKGAENIWMVYDLSKNGLNLCLLWVPRFPLPNLDTHLRAVVLGTWMRDLDLGEMFLHFALHLDIQKVCGLDLTQYESAMEDLCAKEGVYFERGKMGWMRCAMGLQYGAVWSAMVAEEFI